MSSSIHTVKLESRIRALEAQVLHLQGDKDRLRTKVEQLQQVRINRSRLAPTEAGLISRQRVVPALQRLERTQLRRCLVCGSRHREAAVRSCTLR
jgi:hypothetical protein